MTTNEELVAEIAELRERVTRTEDILAIHELKATYGQLVDDRYTRGRVVDGADLERISNEIAALFTEDGVWDGGPALGKVSGRRAIAEQMRNTTLVFSRHLFVKPRIRVDGDRATARWDILCPCKTPDGTSQWMCGYEDDVYERDGKAVWLHSSMKLTTVFFSPTDPGWDRILW